ncbi:FAD binding domain-containing protein [Pleurostoma richardsiae]|uniref:FAD binding domain-containing protein n=1 Tax=Pleurostoma richardsiae TaxID=41990 RepID=A0AA38RKJ4_9PEZI|nr:FAD binding domain-containing protein [Pleurostoma richardsiae]
MERAGQLPLDEQMAHFRATLEHNTTLTEVLKRAATLDLPGWYLAAGCLSQTIWNVATGKPPGSSISDYDLVYCDLSDLSWEAEDAVIRTGAALFADLGVEVEIRNQARVHLWYEKKFGVPGPAPFTSTEAAIDSWVTSAAQHGVRLTEDGSWKIYAPRGLSDVFNMVVRPVPSLGSRKAYEVKAARWLKVWPGLTVMPWTGESGKVEEVKPVSLRK